jgi:hypothetical protein
VTFSLAGIEELPVSGAPSTIPPHSVPVGSRFGIILASIQTPSKQVPQHVCDGRVSQLTSSLKESGSECLFETLRANPNTGKWFAMLARTRFMRRPNAAIPLVLLLLLIAVAVAIAIPTTSTGKVKLEAAGADDESPDTTGAEPGTLDNDSAVLVPAGAVAFLNVSLVSPRTPMEE